LTGRIVDEADILPGSTRGEIEAKLVALEAKSTDQLVVVTLQSLRGRTIEDYGIALGRHWKLAQLSQLGEKSQLYQRGDGESLHYTTLARGRTALPGAVIRGGGCGGRTSLSCWTRIFCSAVSSV